MEEDIYRLDECLSGESMIEKLIDRAKDTNIIYRTNDTVLNTMAVQKLAKYIENLLTRYKQQQKLINKLAEHIAISGLERSWTKTFEEDVEDIKKMFINEVEEEGD